MAAAIGAAITITEESAVTPALLAAFARLLPQLAPLAPPLDQAALAEIIAAPATTLLTARDERDFIVGSLTLVVFRIPGGCYARIESVVVDEAARGKGAGAALCQEAIVRARARGADKIDLTSLPARAAANRLYQRLGFQQRATNVYRLVLRAADHKGS
jgi:ribosomal protein S18 acetylase RimI-like enzyme